MEDDYHTYRNADTEEQRQGIRTKFSDQKMFESAMVWSMYDYRKRAYPPIEEQLDMIYRNGLDHWKSEIQGIKSKYPDMTNNYTKKNQDNRIEDIKATLETTRTTLEGDLQTINSRLTTTRTELTETKADLQTAQTTELTEIKADLSDTKVDLQTTRTELVEERTLHETTRTQLRNTQTELDVAKIKLLNIEARMQIIESNISKVVV